MRAPRVFSPRWECRQINALFVSFTPRTRVSIAIIEGVTLSLSSFFLSFLFPVLGGGGGGGGGETSVSLFPRQIG